MQLLLQFRQRGCIFQFVVRDANVNVGEGDENQWPKKYFCTKRLRFQFNDIGIKSENVLLKRCTR